MPSIGSGDGDDSAEDFTDLDEDLLSPDDPLDRPVDLAPEDFTDLDDDLLYFHREEDLRDRYGPLGLTAITVVHFLPALVGFLPGVLGVDTTSLTPSVGLDLYFATGVAAFFSGVAAHLAREYGSRYLLRYGVAALLGGSAIYLLTLANAVLAPDTYLTADGIADGVFPQLNAGIIALSVIGGLLVVARLAHERYRAD